MKDFNMKEYITELEKIVNIESDSKNIKGVAEVADYFYDKYKKLFLNVEKIQNYSEVGPCLKVTNTNEENYDVLFLGHMDTVFPKGTIEERPFKKEGNKVFGPGVIDMKGPLLSLYYAVKELVDKENLKKFCILLNSEEEIGSKHYRELIEKIAEKSKYTLVIEHARPDGALVIERKGSGGYDIEFTGKASHAGSAPEKGRNAISEMAYWINKLNEVTDFEKGTTINCGIANGGTAKNVVAEKAYLGMEFRVKKVEAVEEIIKKIEDLKKHAEEKEIKLKIIGGLNRGPMVFNEKSKKLFEIIKEAGKELEIEIKGVSSGGGSDGNITSTVGSPTIDGLGPVGGGQHSVDEYLELDSVEERIELIVKIMEKLN